MISGFDPNGMAVRGSLYGLPFTPHQARVVVYPVPWDVTVSYRSGTVKGPKAILNASAQVDLYDPAVSDAWKIGLAMLPASKLISTQAKNLRKKAEKYLEALESGDVADKQAMDLQLINYECERMVQQVQEDTSFWLNQGKLVALVGGDHSTPLGLIRALSKKHSSFGILQIDAHADLREAYEGFNYSHASIMYNALQTKPVKKLVQVGIRDYCEEEADLISANPKRIKTFFARDLWYQRFEGKTWAAQCAEIIATLPQKVYLSLDVDGLEAWHHPNTGTPVPGGMGFYEVLYLVEKLVEKGKTIIGLDINETAPGSDEWDASVSARLLYRLCNLMAKSNK